MGSREPLGGNALGNLAHNREAAVSRISDDRKPTPRFISCWSAFLGRSLLRIGQLRIEHFHWPQIHKCWEFDAYLGKIHQLTFRIVSPSPQTAITLGS